MEQIIPAVDCKRLLRGIFVVTLIAVLIDGVASFYIFGKGVHEGVSKPDAVHSERLTNQGVTVYIAPERKQLIDFTQIIMKAGIVALVIGAIFLHFIIGVRLFPSSPTLSEILEKRRQKR